jgi:hypothetical protein
VNARGNGTFLSLAAEAAPAVIRNNVFVGGGTLSNQAGALLSNNLEDAASCLVDAAGFDYRLSPGAPCIDAGVDPGDGDGFALRPSQHYAHPTGHAARPSQGELDLGAYELSAETPGEGGSPSTAGTGGDAPSAGKPSTAGTPSAGSANDTGGSGAGSEAAEQPTAGDDSSCGCRLARRGSPSSTGLGVVALAATAWLSQRRRKRHWQ